MSIRPIRWLEVGRSRRAQRLRSVARFAFCARPREARPAHRLDSLVTTAQPTLAPTCARPSRRATEQPVWDSLVRLLVRPMKPAIA